MKETILVLAALSTLFSLTATASSSSINLGYVDGQPGTGYYGSASAAGEVSAAIYIPAELLAKYAGCEVSGSRAMLYSRLNIESMRFWLREGLLEPDACMAELTKTGIPELAKGWNEVAYESPYVIPEDPERGVYVGVTYIQSGGSMGIASSGECVENGGFLKPVGEDWSDMSSEFTFCIEAVLTGDRLPKLNLRLDSVDFFPYYVLDNGEYRLTATVTNIATEPVTDFNITVSSECFHETFSHTYECNLEYGDSETVDIIIPTGVTAQEGLHEVMLTVDEVNGEADDDMDDNSSTGIFRIVPFDMTKRVLIEEFTTEKCSNCPRVAGWMHEMLEDPYYSSIAVPVCHHAGYGTDSFTIPSDEEYTWFYDPTFMFAPAIMVDRRRSANGTPPFNPSSREAMCESVMLAAQGQSEVSLSLHAEILGDRLEVTVRGAKGVDELCDDPRLVCVVTEDDVPALHQAGAEGNGQYLHQHVSRAVNATWGTEVDFNGDLYEYETSLSLEKVSNIKNINLVGYIFNYDPTSRLKCEVKNAAILPYDRMGKASSSPAPSESVEADGWYTISGMRLPHRPKDPGLYIEKSGGSARKTMIRPGN